MTLSPMKNRARVAQLVLARAAEMHMSRTQLAAAAGLSTNAIRPLLQGKDVSMYPHNLARISDALGWGPHGLAMALADPGYVPTVVSSPSDGVAAVISDVGKVLGRRAARTARADRQPKSSQR